MESFAQQSPGKPGGRKILLMGLAAASFSIWYFDLAPDLAPVPTGQLDPVTEDQFNEDDFLKMLKSDPGAALAQTSDAESPADGSFTESLEEALQSQSEPATTDDSLTAAFPEFGSLDDAPAQEAAGNVVPASFEANEPVDSPPDVRMASTAGLTPAAANPTEGAPLVLSPEIAEQLRAADGLIEQGETLEAHATLSRLYWRKPELRSELLTRIEQTAATIYADPAAHFGEPRMVRPGETLEGIAKEYKVPWQYLARLNRTTPETLQAGQELKVLTGPFGAVVDLDEFELTIHAHGWFVRRYDIGIGADQRTPPGDFTVQNKVENPTWYNPSGGIVAADDPSNPLGEFWLGLGDHIGIHGTIDPQSIGRDTSRGCIHLGDADIAEVFHLLGPGSPVRIRR